MSDKSIPLPEITILKVQDRDYSHLKEYFCLDNWFEDDKKYNHYEVFIPYEVTI